MTNYKRMVTLTVATLVGYAAFSYFYMSTWDKWNDWERIASVENSAKSMTAVLEKNIHFGSAGYKPIIQVSLFEKSGIRRVVWMSGEKSSPTMSWTSDTELNISYQHNLSSDYVPFLEVDEVDFTVSLEMNLDSDSIYTSTWENWNWEKQSLIENPSTGVHAIVERGEHSNDGAAPIIRIALIGNDGKHHEVWSGTEYTARPKVSWVDAETLEISVISFNSYSFYPAKKLDESVYKVALAAR